VAFDKPGRGLHGPRGNLRGVFGKLEIGASHPRREVIESGGRTPFVGEPFFAVDQVRVLGCQEEASFNQLCDVRALLDLDPRSLRDREERVQDVHSERRRVTRQRRRNERRIPFAVNEEERRSPNPRQRLAGSLGEPSHVDRLFRSRRLRLRRRFRLGLLFDLPASDERCHVDVRPLRLWLWRRLWRRLRLRRRLWLFQYSMCHAVSFDDPWMGSNLTPPR
jgi:hypothetical protein